MKRSKRHLSYISPATVKRSKLVPICKKDATQSSLADYSVVAKSEPPQEEINSVVTQEEIISLLQTSLMKYPKLANSIRRLEREKIACKCSVFSKNFQNLDRVHGFSSVACASDFCINRILEEPENPIQVFTKSPKFYSLSPEKKPDKYMNKDLILYEQNTESITRAVRYFHKYKESEEEYKSLYTEYIKRPDIFKVPRPLSKSPNFSVPKPNMKQKVL